jgi:CrcB protein
MPSATMATLLVAIGGALGSVARYWLGIAVVARTGPAFPWGTLLINVIGGFVIGLAATGMMASGRVPMSSGTRLFVMVGFCGGFTTFSAYSLQTLELFEAGAIGAALLYAAGSVVLCFLAVAAGASLGRM